MGNAGHFLPVRHSITSEFVGNQSIGRALLAFETLAEDALGGSPVTPSLKQDVNDVAVLVDGSPKIVAVALDVDEHFIERPVISQHSLFTVQLAGKLGPESATPTANRFVADRYAP